MTNTTQTYDANETLGINPNFDNLLPSLTDAERSHLEESILKEGIREPIRIWQGFIIDGHNRYEIAKKHGLDYPVADVSDQLADEDAVKEWMLMNQVGRRNLEPHLRKLYIGEIYNLRKKAVGNPAFLASDLDVDYENDIDDRIYVSDAFEPVFGEDEIDDDDDTEIVFSPKNHYSATVAELENQPQQESGNLAGENDPEIVLSPKNHNVATVATLENQPQRTEEILAEEMNVSPRTVRNAGRLSEAFKQASPELQEQFLKREITEKKLLESVLPAPETDGEQDEKDNRRDAFSAAATRFANKLIAALKNVDDVIAQGRGMFQEHGQRLPQYSTKINSFHGREFILHAKLLKQIIRCPICDTAKCKYCQERGYVRTGKLKEVMSHYEYDQRGGITR